ncbi:helix-turn-helix transcriptional regulator [Amycolatopsis pigmentata]|uniref:Helix-turn-helix transcriptional regulator n=1 Tax=Amycolatopsis pigmentata TaxID=450801 RepID=A0ABW5FKX5_9PSEU
MVGEELGSFLKAQRAKVQPDPATLAGSGYRRVSGLRREEVAVQAGVSVDYYARLEQGRERHPSPQMLDALSRALGLDDDARSHLYRLAGLTPPSPDPGVREKVSPELLRLMEAWPATPAYVVNRTMDLLAHNQLAEALHSGFAEADNLIRMAFLDPAGREFFADWQRAAHASVANLRVAAGYDARNPRLLELVNELSRHSPPFRELWNRHDVRGKSREPKEFQHPDVGRLTLTYEAFDVRSAPGQQLIVYHAVQGTPSAEALTLLGSIAATRRTIQPRS